MLTIKEPIRLTINSSLQMIRPKMMETMSENYGLMNLPIRKEELLHLTSQSPEIYFAEGDELLINNLFKNENVQEIRLSIINNLMNRILTANTNNFTYHDTVYISTLLRKLGIRDEKTFMNQVFRLQQEQKETKQLLKKYEEHKSVLQQMFSLYEKEETGEKKSEDGAPVEKGRLFLHQTIYNRLKTGKIYQEIRNFSKNIFHDGTVIHPVEMMTAEQTRAAENLLLCQMKSEVTHRDAPFTYVHHNQYEYLQEIVEENTQNLEEQISAAILLNLADESYSLRQEMIEKNEYYWFQIADSFFQTAENTWKRYEANLTERKHVGNDSYHIWEEINHMKVMEGDVISRMIQEYKTNSQIYHDGDDITNLQEEKSFFYSERGKESINAGTFSLSREELELYHTVNIEDNEE